MLKKEVGELLDRSNRMTIALFLAIIIFAQVLFQLLLLFFTIWVSTFRFVKDVTTRMTGRLEYKAPESIQIL